MTITYKQSNNFGFIQQLWQRVYKSAWSQNYLFLESQTILAQDTSTHPLSQDSQPSYVIKCEWRRKTDEFI